jgi:hypothetical protein
MTEALKIENKQTGQNTRVEQPNIIGGYINLGSILPKSVLDAKLPYLEHLLDRALGMTLLEAINGDAKEIVTYSPHKLSEDFVKIWEQVTGKIITSVTYEDIIKPSFYRSLKEKSGKVKFLLYTKDLSAGDAKTMFRIKRLIEKRNPNLEMVFEGIEESDYQKERSSADLANDKSIFLKIVEEIAKEEQELLKKEKLTEKELESITGIINFPEKEAKEILYQKNEKGEKIITKETLEDIQTYLITRLQAKVGTELVVQSPKSGGGIGTQFIKNEEDIRKFLYTTDETGLTQFEQMCSNDERPRITELLVAPKVNQVGEPSTTFRINPDGTVDKVLVGGQLTEKETNSAIGTTTFCDLPEDVQKRLDIFSIKFAKKLYETTGYYGPSNVDFSIVQTATGEILIVAAETNSRDTAKTAIINITTAHPHLKEGVNYDQFYVPKDKTLKEILDVLEQNGVPVLKNLSDSTQTTGILPQTSINPKSHKFSLLFFAPTPKEVTALYEKTTKIINTI